jgi:DNA-binding LacI/PurR family transcriptional regulator
MKIFISHSTIEKALADSLAHVLRDAFPGVEVKYSSDVTTDEGIAPGDRWHGWILDQVRTSSVTLVVLSHQSTKNEWLLWEAGAASGVALATKDATTVIPCLYGVDADELPAPLAVRQSVRADTELGICRILRTIAKRRRRGLRALIRPRATIADTPVEAVDLSFLPGDTQLTAQELADRVAESRDFIRDNEWHGSRRDVPPVFVLFPSLRDDPFYLDLLAGLTSTQRPDLDLSFHLPLHAYDGALYTEKLESLLNTQASYQGGIIAPTLSDDNRERVKSLIASFEIPTVIVDINPFGPDELPGKAAYLGFDNTQGGQLAAKAMLHELGDRSRCSILVLGADDQPERHQSFLDALPDHVDTRLEKVPFSRSDARSTVERIFRHENAAFDGIFGVSDEIAIGALEATTGHDGIVVVGYDGIPAARTLIDIKSNAFRRTIAQDPFKLGVQAITLLAGMIKDGRAPTVKTMPVSTYP